MVIDEDINSKLPEVGDEVSFVILSQCLIRKFIKEFKEQTYWTLLDALFILFSTIH